MRGHFGSRLVRAARVFSVRRPRGRYGGDRNGAAIGFTPTERAGCATRRLPLAGTIIGIIPILLAYRVIVEFHALNNMVAEPDTDISVRLNVARH
jgi:hypothetical protein